MNTKRFTVPRRRNLAEAIVDNLKAKIEGGVYETGDRLPTEPAVMAEHGVSRTVVREAISRLQAAGLVETRHGIGSFVLEPQKINIDTGTVVTIRDVVSMLELRISLETEAAALAALRRKDEHLAEMRRAIDAFQQDIDAERDGASADFQFHLQIVLATHNRYFESVFRHLGKTTIPRTRVDTTKFSTEPGPAYLERTNNEHESIFDAILRQDPEAARASARMHLSYSRERLRRASDASDG